MGHEVTNEGINIDPQKAKAILEMSKPTNVEDVQRFNGFVNYLPKFLPKLADSMEPIHRLIRKAMIQGHPTSIFGKYLFERRFEI